MIRWGTPLSSADDGGVPHRCCPASPRVRSNRQRCLNVKILHSLLINTKLSSAFRSFPSPAIFQTLLDSSPQRGGLQSNALWTRVQRAVDRCPPCSGLKSDADGTEVRRAVYRCPTCSGQVSTAQWTVVHRAVEKENSPHGKIKQSARKNKSVRRSASSRGR